MNLKINPSTLIRNIIDVWCIDFDDDLKYILEDNLNKNHTLLDTIDFNIEKNRIKVNDELNDILINGNYTFGFLNSLYDKLQSELEKINYILVEEKSHIFKIEQFIIKEYNK